VRRGATKKRSSKDLSFLYPHFSDFGEGLANARLDSLYSIERGESGRDERSVKKGAGAYSLYVTAL